MVEKHEIEDRVPVVYEEVIGEPYPALNSNEASISATDLELLKSVCAEIDDSDVHYEVVRNLLHIEHQNRTMARQKHFFGSLKSPGGGNFFICRRGRTLRRRPTKSKRPHHFRGSRSGAELVLHNFGIYRGRHVVDLRPKSTDKPILLFGGLNGGGKTTFLDAMKLALYGKLADCSNRKSLPYEAFLEAAINRHSPPAEGAALELEFVTNRAGVETCFRVKRFWRKTSKSVSESIEVLEDGALSPVLSSHWAQHVDEFIPQDIAGLFFFDGEKIESLADKHSSASIIRTGIYSLLGLNLIDKLEVDLRQLNKRRAGSVVNNPVVEQIVLEASLESLTKKTTQLKARRAELNTREHVLKNTLAAAKKKFEDAGGDFFKNRETNLERRRLIEEKLAQSRSSMLEMAAGIAPMCLVENLLTEAREQSHREHQAEIASAFNSQIEDRDAIILKLVDEQAGSKVSGELASWMLEDRKGRQQNASQARYLSATPASSMTSDPRT